MQLAIWRFTLLILLVSTSLATRGQQQPVSQADQPQRNVRENLAWSFRAYAGPSLPADRGLSGLWQDLQKLHTRARVMVTAAHPDDEPGALLTLEGRGRGATTLMMALTRGEGGQNRTGSELFDELGILRTLELMAADKYYGTERRFSHAADFGFSKTAEETLQKWGGHDPVLSDIVRVIREFKPDVLVSRFSGTPRDGHGNHQASGILTREAFRAAADPNRFPEQIREGLQPWQAKKFYVCTFGGTTAATLINTGEYSPALGESYLQFALQGLAHQLSQVLPRVTTPSDSFERCQLEQSLMPSGSSERAAAEDLWAGIDTSLLALGDHIDPALAPFLPTGLQELDKDAQEAIAGFSATDPSKCAPPLLAGAAVAEKLIVQARNASLPPEQKSVLETELETKLQQFRNAANEALAVVLIATVDAVNPPQQSAPVPLSPSTQLFVNPGETFTVTARLYNRSPIPIVPQEIALDVPPEWKVEAIEGAKSEELKANQNAQARFRITVPDNAQYTRPYWHRVNQEEDAVYIIDDPRWATLPFSPPPIRARAAYSASGGHSAARTVVEARYLDPIYGQKQRPLAVAPALSVQLEPVTNVLNTERANAPQQIYVTVQNTGNADVQGTLRLNAPSGWQVQPAEIPIKAEANETGNYNFSVRPSNLREQHYDLRATVEANGHKYAEGFRTISREDLGAYFYYSPARQNVSAVNVKLPQNLVVGYIMGAGDDIPQVLEQIGLNVQTISSQELAAGDLSRYGTIVLGIRAYDVRQDLRNYNRRLLQYVQNGGTLLVQYNQNVGNFNSGHYTPFPASEANERVTVEEAPVQILDPQNPVMRYPNVITPHDFENWVQERGLYFMGQWSNDYTPLLASGDPGEQPLKGGLLVAHYGKGTYIYTGYAFFRQLPSGVPGAIRLFVNLVAAGHVGRQQAP